MVKPVHGKVFVVRESSMHNTVINELLDNESGLKEYIRSILSQHKRRIIPREDLKESAVLLPLCWKDGEPQVVVTMRSMGVEHHKGEIWALAGTAAADVRVLEE